MIFKNKMITKIQKFEISISISIFFFVFCVPSVFAADIFFQTRTENIEVNKLFEIGVFINTNNESINAIEGTIVFPSDLLEIKNINNGNSIINFWIERPATKSDGQISFSGIIPGGYESRQGSLVIMTFLVKKAGAGIVGTKNINVLKNDGMGTEALLTTSNYEFLAHPATQVEKEERFIEDLNPPELFVPEVVSDPNIFDGKWFLIFSTQDKGSGIERYEVLEKRESKNWILNFIGKKWTETEGLYLLQDQELKSHIYVKAVDRVGNERIVSLLPKEELFWYEKYFHYGIIFASAISFFIIWKIFRRKKRK